MSMSRTSAGTGNENAHDAFSSQSKALPTCEGLIGPDGVEVDNEVGAAGPIS